MDGGLVMTEMTTMLTDYILGILAFAFGYILLRKSRGDHVISRLLWAYAFFFISLSTVVGGTYHGFRWQDNLGGLLWKISSISMCFTSLFMAASIVWANCVGKTRRAWVVIVGIKFLLFVGLVFVSDEFLLVIADYGLVMLAIFVVALVQTFRKTRPDAPWFVAGVVVSFIAAGVQVSGVSLYEYFNYNDLFHLIQMPALYLFLRGGLILTDNKKKGVQDS